MKPVHPVNMFKSWICRPLLLASAGCVFLTIGCTRTRGPELVVNSHIEYNRAISQVLKEELLLNVVRRRYLEPLQFVNVSSISTSLGMTVNANASASIDNSATNTSKGRGLGVAGFSANHDSSSVGTGLGVSNVGVGGGLSFSDSPTVTITPRQGEDIASQLHEPLAVSTIADLIASGYPIDTTLQMLVQGINDLRGPTLRYDQFRPGSPEWREAMGLIKRLSDNGSFVISRFRWNDPLSDIAYPAASITPETWVATLASGNRRWKSYDGGKTFQFTTHEMAPAAWMDDDARKTPDGQRLMELLNIQPDVQKRIWFFEPARVVDGPDLTTLPHERRPTLKLRMRTLYNVITLYSYLVAVPPGDETEGRATDLTTFHECVARGEVQNFPEAIKIQFSDKHPASAFLCVPYRGGWFYIDDGDRMTKVAFNTLYDLWQLSIREPASTAAPVTTIQVN